MAQLYTRLTELSTSMATMSESMPFAEWFQKQLRRRDWNQSDAARAIGVSSSVVNRWYRGERVPDPKSCDVIADVLAVPVDLVLELAGHRPPAAEIDPDSPAPLLVSLVERVRWNPEREAAVESILRGFIERDRRSDA
jgi:transcriptional regulator with XRE-family HTH domain